MLRREGPSFKVLAIILPIVALAIVSSVAAQGGDPDDVASPAAASGPSEEPALAPALAAPASVEDEYSQLDASIPQRSEDAIPAESSLAPAVEATGLSPDEAQFATDAGNHGVWLAPSADGACIVDLPPGANVLAPGVTCDTTEQLLAGEMYVTVGGGGDEPDTLIALVPDGARAPDIRGSDQSAEIAGNVLVGDLFANATGYAYEVGGDKVEVDVPKH